MTLNRGTVLAGLAVAVAAAACGSGSAAAHRGHAPNDLLTAYQKTLAAKSAKVSFDDAVQVKTAGGATHEVNVTGSGVANFAGHAVALTTNVSPVGDIEVRIVGDWVYIHFPPEVQSSLPGDRPWVSLDLNKLTKAKVGQSFQSLENEGNNNPVQSLSYLQGVSTRVTKVGTTTLGGTKVTEYRASVNLSKLAAKDAAQGRAAAAKSIRAAEGQLKTKVLPVAVWIDGRGLVHKERIRIPVPATTGTTTGTSTVTVGFSDFGVPVHVSPPPGSQTENLTRLAVASGAGA